jgi:hypothetical protein
MSFREWAKNKVRKVIGVNPLVAAMKEHIDRRTAELMQHSRFRATELLAAVADDATAFADGLFRNRHVLQQQARELISRCGELVGKEGAHRAIREEVFPRLAWILAAPDFTTLELPLQRSLLQAVAFLLITTGSRKSPLAAELLASVFDAWQDREDTNLHWLMEMYDSLYGLYWTAAGDLAEMMSFDRQVVRKFAACVRQRFDGPPPWSGRAPARRPLRVGYLCHYGDLAPGNAVTPIVSALVKTHCQGAVSTGQVYLYTVQWYHEEFARSFAGLPVTVRPFAVSRDTAEAETLRQAVLADQIDVLLTDIASAAATYLFESRTAPLQLWLEMGYPCWSIAHLDWAFLGHKSHRDYYGIDRHKCSTIRFGQERTSMERAVSAEEIAAVRAKYPAGAKLLGTWCRLSKITPEYLALVERILARNPAAHLILAGSGDPELIDRFLLRSPLAGRITFHPHSIDPNVYVRIIDAFLDTFPFCGGNACRIVGLFGKPVVSMWTPEWDLLMAESRDAALLARNADEYLASATRLLCDESFYRQRSQVARELSQQETEVTGALEEILRVIGNLWPQSAARAAA